MGISLAFSIPRSRSNGVPASRFPWTTRTNSILNRKSSITNRKLFRPSVEPKLEAKDSPKCFAMVGSPRPMFFQQTPHESGVKQPVALEFFFTERLFKQRAQCVAHPARDGNGKPALLAVDDFAGQPLLHRPLEQVFELKASHLERGGQAGGEFHQAVVEKRCAQLQRACHAGTVDFHQKIVLEVHAEIEVEHCRDRVVKPRPCQNALEGRKYFRARGRRALPI